MCDDDKSSDFIKKQKWKKPNNQSLILKNLRTSYKIYFLRIKCVKSIGFSYS